MEEACQHIFAFSRSCPSMCSSRRRWVCLLFQITLLYLFHIYLHYYASVSCICLRTYGCNNNNVALESTHLKVSKITCPLLKVLILNFVFCVSVQVDLAVIEVGIGGAYDCTNIIRQGIVDVREIFPLFYCTVACLILSLCCVCVCCLHLILSLMSGHILLNLTNHWSYLLINWLAVSPYHKPD